MLHSNKYQYHICNNNSNISSNMTYFNSDSASSHKPVEQCSDDDNSENNSQSTYDLSTLIENNVEYDNTTNENNSYENDVHEYDILHEDQSSMSAQSMLNLGLSKKGFKMGHLNIQGIQNKIDQIDLLLNSSQNNIHVQSNLYKSATFGSKLNWLSYRGVCLIKGQSERPAWQNNITIFQYLNASFNNGI